MLMAVAIEKKVLVEVEASCGLGWMEEVVLISKEICIYVIRNNHVYLWRSRCSESKCIEGSGMGCWFVAAVSEVATMLDIVHAS